MHYYNTIHFVDSSLGSILTQIDQVIEQIQASKKIPVFLTQSINPLIYQVSSPFAYKPQSANKLLEQDYRSIPKINKDTLMPKDVDKETPPLQIKTLTVNPSKGNKLFSTISKKSSKNDIGIKSLSLTQRRSLKIAKNDQKLQMLRVEIEQDDPQTLKLRQRTQMRVRHEQQYKKMILQRQKSFMEKSQFLSQLTEGQSNAVITHDYEGEQLKSIIADDKIKSYSMKAEFAPLVKQKKEGGLGQPQISTIQTNRYNKDNDNANKTIRAMQMPLFPATQRDLSQLHQIKNYRLHDYRKHFGRRYSRLDQSQTIDESYKQKQEVHKDEIFSEKRHLRDSSMALQTSRQSVMQNRAMRRLALPRLHGKYKVLDRYQQF